MNLLAQRLRAISAQILEHTYDYESFGCHINVLSCAAIVDLPGSAGTVAEVSLALRYRKPVIAYLEDDSLENDFPKAIRRAANVDDVRRFLLQCLSSAV